MRSQRRPTYVELPQNALGSIAGQLVADPTTEQSFGSEADRAYPRDPRERKQKAFIGRAILRGAWGFCSKKRLSVGAV